MLVYDKILGTVSEGRPDGLPDKQEVAWVRLVNRPEAELRKLLADTFGCHPLLVEDCVKLNQRPKLDRYRNNVFLTFFHIKPKSLALQEIGIVIGANYVITVSKDEVPFLDEVFQELLEIEGRMTHAGDVLYHILDRGVDKYTDIVDSIENQVERLERTIYKNPALRVAPEIFSLKRHLHQIRRIIAEEKTIVGAISHQSLPYTRQETDVYFIDIYDHISRVIDSLDSFRESLTGLLELQMSMKSDRMNEIMKTLTVMSSIFLPLTFIVGLYGMNFQSIPELKWQHGYAFVWIVMLIVAAAMWAYYKRKKWW